MKIMIGFFVCFVTISSGTIYGETKNDKPQYISFPMCCFDGDYSYARMETTGWTGNGNETMLDGKKVYLINKYKEIITRYYECNECGATYSKQYTRYKQEKILISEG